MKTAMFVYNIDYFYSKLKNGSLWNISLSNKRILCRRFIFFWLILIFGDSILREKEKSIASKFFHDKNLETRQRSRKTESKFYGSFSFQKYDFKFNKKKQFAFTRAQNQNVLKREFSGTFQMQDLLRRTFCKTRK